MTWTLILAIWYTQSPVQLDGYSSEKECRSAGNKAIQQCSGGEYLRLCKDIGYYTCIQKK